MKILRKLKTFHGSSKGLKWLFLRAFFLSAVVKFTLRYLPYRCRLRWMGLPNNETGTIGDDSLQQQRTLVKQALGWCKIYSPWNTECYTMAITGKILLRQIGIDSTLYIGFRKKEDQSMEGHAWLRSGNVMITGGEIAPLFSVHTYYT